MGKGNDKALDAMVVGLGLAGCAVAWSLVRRGLDFRVVEAVPGECGRDASRVAAGLVTPVTGRRMSVSSMVPLCLPYAEAFYPWVEKAIGEACWHPFGIVRVFGSGEERAVLEKKVEGGAGFPIECMYGSGQLGEWGLKAGGWGGFGMRGGAWLDIEAYLDGTRRWLLERGLLVEAEMRAEALQWRGDAVVWRDMTVAEVVCCQGLAARDDALWKDWLSFRPAAGDILVVRVEGLDRGRIYNCGGRWLAPRDNGIWLCGASYDFQNPLQPDRRHGREDLEAWLGSMVAGQWEVVDQLYGVRPIIRQSQPVAGRHPEHSGLSLLNGLGSRGVLTAPWAADALVEHLFAGADLPELLRYPWRKRR